MVVAAGLPDCDDAAGRPALSGFAAESGDAGGGLAGDVWRDRHLDFGCHPEG